MQYRSLVSKILRPGAPLVEYTELDDGRWETRKVAEFANQEFGYAYVDGDQVIELGGTGLSDKPWHSDQDHREWLELNPQYSEIVISRAEFENLWEQALAFWKLKS